MAAPEANLSGVRGAPGEMGSSHTPGGPPRHHLQNFNAIQFVSQLVSATPPYLFSMSSPFPGTFFSDLLRRMAPRAGTPGLPPDLQQQIRAALLAKSTPPPSLAPGAMLPPLDMASVAAAAQQQQHHHSQQTPHLPLPPPSTATQQSISQEKGTKRSLFADVSALSSCDDESVSNSSKRLRLEEDRPSANEPIPASPFLMQSPFLPPPPGAPPHDVLSPWSRSMIRPQVPLPAHVPPAPLDPYRLLLDLRLAGQLRNMAASHVLHHKDTPAAPSSVSSGFPSSVSGVSMPLPTTQASRSVTPPSSRPESLSHNSITPPNGTLRPSGDDRVSAFHPPGREAQDTSDEDAAEPRSSSRSSGSSSNGSRESVGPQYIFRHLTQIYRSIEGQRGDEPTENKNPSTNSSTDPVNQRSSSPHVPVPTTDNGVNENTLTNGHSEDSQQQRPQNEVESTENRSQE